MMYKLIFFVPESHLEQVKTVLFAKGAGSDNRYSECCWQVLGQMQYKPLPGAEPAIGKINRLSISQEYRVEMVCKPSLIKDVIEELLRIHPYEVPAYEIYKLENY